MFEPDQLDQPPRGDLSCRRYNQSSRSGTHCIRLSLANRLPVNTYTHCGWITPSNNGRCRLPPGRPESSDKILGRATALSRHSFSAIDSWWLTQSMILRFREGHFDDMLESVGSLRTRHRLYHSDELDAVLGARSHPLERLGKQLSTGEQARMTTTSEVAFRRCLRNDQRPASGLC